mgnify:CR=1 FL=1
MTNRTVRYDPSIWVEDALDYWQEGVLVVAEANKQSLVNALWRLIKEKKQIRNSIDHQIDNLQKETEPQKRKEELALKREWVDARIFKCQKMVANIPVIRESDKVKNFPA